MIRGEDVRTTYVHTGHEQAVGLGTGTEHRLEQAQGTGTGARAQAQAQAQARAQAERVVRTAAAGNRGSGKIRFFVHCMSMYPTLNCHILCLSTVKRLSHLSTLISSSTHLSSPHLCTSKNQQTLEHRSYCPPNAAASSTALADVRRW
jgi:hypothetical protein